MVPFERALVTSYRLSIITFPLPLRVSQNAAFVLQHATFPIPTYIVSQKFPHVPLGLGGCLWDTKSESVGLLSTQLVSKISSLCDHNPPTSQTDRQTDIRNAIATPHFSLCTIVHRAVKIEID